MGKIINFTPPTPPDELPEQPKRVEVHVCGLCGSENFWLFQKSITKDVSIHGIACSRCGHQVQGTWQPNEALHLI